MTPTKIVGIVVSMLILNAGFAIWIYFYTYAGTNPNPRIAVNATHSAWTAFQTALPFYGFGLLCFNTVVWYLFFRSRCGLRRQQTSASTSASALSSNPKGASSEVSVINVPVLPFTPVSPEPVTPVKTGWSSVEALREQGIRRWARERDWHRTRFWFNIIVLLPIATSMGIGPFVVPFIAMPLAQEWAWKHRCDSWDLSILLHGRNTSSFSSATFHFNSGGEYTYDLRDGTSFVYRWTGLAHSADPVLQNITYDLATSTLTGRCQSFQQECLSGRMDQDLDSLSFLAFNFTANLGFGNRTSYLRAVDRDWQYSNDAPSMLIRNHVTGADVMRTAVTKKGDCTQLKMCANWFGEADLLVPVGRVLIAQQEWAAGSTCGPKRA